VEKVVRLEALPPAEDARWESLRAIDVSAVGSPVAEAIASHPRIDVVIGLGRPDFVALLANAPGTPLRHVELAPGILHFPMTVLENEATLPHISRLALGTNLDPLLAPWLLTTPVGKRLTHLAFGLDPQRLGELLLVLRDFGNHLEQVALLRPEGTRTVALNMFRGMTVPARFVPWHRVVRDGRDLVEREVEVDATEGPIFQLPSVSAEPSPPFYVPRTFPQPSRRQPTFEPWPEPASRPGAPPMDDDRFWAIIEGARAQTARIDDAFVALVTARLAELPAREIVAFDDRRDSVVARAHTVDLRVASYIATGFWSDDGFLYFAHWLVARGRDAFARVVAEPDALAVLAAPQMTTPDDACEMGLETLMYSASKAYELRTGEDMPSRPPDPLARRVFTNTSPPPLDRLDLERRFPRLWRRFRSKR
jgi:hypothetical protein